jgi:hypothetical protein
LTIACANNGPDNYNPTINPSAFATEVTHPLFPLPQGKTWSYTEGATKSVDITVLPERKTLLGVSCMTVHDVVKDGGVIEEDTLDWYAQDKDGNVWYFGEDTKELDAQGHVLTTAGSWAAGVNGAKPGLIMPAHPSVGDEWREEYLAGEAEDAAKALSLNAGITVPAGKFTGCLKTFNFTRLHPESNEMKVYCPNVGLVWQIDLATDEVEELQPPAP